MPDPEPVPPAAGIPAEARARRFYVRTFGCRCNQADTAGIRGQLAGLALEEAAGPESAGLIVLNSCTVTAGADQEVRRTLRKLGRDHPAARLVVTGCYAQRDPRALAAIPGVDLVIGTADRDRLAAIVAEAGEPPGAARIVRAPLEELRDYLLPEAARTGARTRPFIKIQDGCDARCSYCVVPFVRGPGRSASPDAVLEQARRLIAGGFQEIVVSGVHIGSYGRKLAGPTTLATLLRRMLALPGLGRLRLSSIEPMRFSPDLVELAAESPRLARHFHLPLQSGSDRILRRMRRPYTAAGFLDLVEQLARRVPGAAIGTDVVVGFPGESESDFEATLECIRRSPICYAHVFPYSARRETEAARLPFPVPAAVAAERARRARALARRKNLEFRKRFLGAELEGLTLGADEGAGERVLLTDNYIHVRAGGPVPEPNRRVRVRIERVELEATHGTAGAPW